MEYAVKSTRITREMVDELMPGILRNAAQSMRDAWSAHGDDVMGEILEMRQHREDDPIGHAQAALICSILSPGTELPKNIRQARRIMENLDREYPNQDSMYQVATANKTDAGGKCGGGPARGVWQSIDYIRNINPQWMDKPSLLALRKERRVMGIASKTASFAAALYDECAPVFTLDVHMMRWLCVVGDMPELVAGSMNIDTDAYDALEPVLVAIARAAVPEAPVFGIQWAVWNSVSQGAHREHISLYR